MFRFKPWMIGLIVRTESKTTGDVFVGTIEEIDVHEGARIIRGTLTQGIHIGQRFRFSEDHVAKLGEILKDYGPHTHPEDFV